MQDGTIEHTLVAIPDRALRYTALWDYSCGDEEGLGVFSISSILAGFEPSPGVINAEVQPELYGGDYFGSLFRYAPNLQTLAVRCHPITSPADLNITQQLLPILPDLHSMIIHEVYP